MRFVVVKIFVTVLAETFRADLATFQNCANPRRLGRFCYSNRRGSLQSTNRAKIGIYNFYGG